MGILWDTKPDFTMSKREGNKMTEFEEDSLKWRGVVLTGDFRHWCNDWDGLPVDETTPEFEACSCLKLNWFERLLKKFYVWKVNREMARAEAEARSPGFSLAVVEHDDFFRSIPSRGTSNDTNGLTDSTQARSDSHSA